jgi:hypothetical protein
LVNAFGGAYIPSPTIFDPIIAPPFRPHPPFFRPGKLAHSAISAAIRRLVFR